MKVDLEFLTDGALYRRVMREEIPAARKSLFIASALVKQTRLEAAGGIVPFCELARDLVERGTRVAFLVSGCPSRPFMETLRAFPAVVSKATWRICPRNHMKIVLIDEKRLYVGSANLTGAGLGMKGASKRNFELGFLTGDRALVRRVLEMTGAIMERKPCAKCGVKKLCRTEHEEFASALKPPESGEAEGAARPRRRSR